METPPTEPEILPKLYFALQVQYIELLTHQYQTYSNTNETLWNEM
jgi:hypothetical protein